MKILIPIVVTLSIFFGLYKYQAKNIPSPVPSNTLVENRTTVQTPNTSNVKGVVKVGGVSEKVYVMGKKFFVFPDYDGVEFDLIDIHGKEIVWKDAPRDWKDLMIEYVRFKPTKHDIEYIVRDWN